MLDLDETGLEYGAHEGSGILGPQLEPRPKPRVVIVWSVVHELDAEMPAAKKTDYEHRRGHPRMLDRRHLPGLENVLEAPRQLFAPMRSGEDVHVVAKSDHKPSMRSEWTDASWMSSARLP